MRNAMTLLTIVLLVALLTGASAQAGVIAADDFSRAASGTLGSLPVSNGGTYTWYEYDPAGKVSIGSTGFVSMYYASGSGNDRCGAAIDGLDIGDFILEASLVYPNSGGAYYKKALDMKYRAESLDAAAKGNGMGGISYRINIGTDGAASLLYGGSSPDTLATGNIGFAPAAGQFVDIKLAIDGDEHEMYVKDPNTGVYGQVLSYTETVAGRRTSGYIGSGVWYNATGFDNIVISEVPEPATLGLLGLGGLAMLRRRRR